MSFSFFERQHYGKTENDHATDGTDPLSIKKMVIIGGLENGGNQQDSSQTMIAYPLRINKNGQFFINTDNPLQVTGTVSVTGAVGINNTVTVKPFTPTVRSGYVFNTTNIPAAPFKIGAGTIRRITLLTTGTSTQRAYLKLYNKITAPTIADIPIFEALFVTGSTTANTTISLDVNIPFSAGLHMAINGAANFTGAATAVGVSNNYFYVIEFE